MVTAASQAASLGVLKWARSTSAICSPTGNTGLRAVIGSWKIIEMRRPRTASRSFSDRYRRLRRLRTISPPVIRPGGGTRPSSASAVIDLPQPLSPTRPRVRPGSRSKDTRSAGRSTPSSVENSTSRSRTLSTGSAGIPRSPLVPSILPVGAVWQDWRKIQQFHCGIPSLPLGVETSCTCYLKMFHFDTGNRNGRLDQEGAPMRIMWIVVVACTVLLSTASRNAEAITFELRDGNLRILDFEGDFEKWSEVCGLMQASGVATPMNRITRLQVLRMAEKINQSKAGRDEKELSRTKYFILDTMKENFGPLYSFLANYYYDNFSKTEIKVMRAFYETPTGKKFVELQPKLNEEYADFMRGWIEQLTPEIKERIRKETRDEHGYH